ncbi:hypothetical protein GCM10010259_13900 [Streptomyces daghestanicus]|uniref:Uncharacterized protein n=1 Tax=Streptomyces daghestanicus TaxID=66885 RepID=A0ABQ3PXP8_9ACTN|nr:hypothetical protein GCM10010240_37550 [Streptomyces griseoviridis]GGU24672.1 hypothetical protein GCM10010259_13900 [Streptomyces daghestanicus]GHI29789.1 hypothetical protein Sdagh_15190 [Streptomyces daghestanicus]
MSSGGAIGLGCGWAPPFTGLLGRPEVRLVPPGRPRGWPGGLRPYGSAQYQRYQAFALRLLRAATRLRREKRSFIGAPPYQVKIT